MAPPHGLLIQSQVSYSLDDSGMGGAAGSRTLTMLIKSQLYCLLILRPQKNVAATGLAPVRSGLKDRLLGLLCIRGQN